ncbi:MAG: tRNA (adenosine(37)-N6)-threonylcarbamoyltransferase complex ATPase subunit type 1 TsaE [Pyrinomonadaceae bacterium]|nr:tRNA (adenosine(37)-N6)-threonylcarbamoyltransferase complex ATPase subunit type 1 TsaE [Sphingobacteriaceae bacterium]
MELTLSNLTELPQAAKALLNFAGDHRIFLFYGEMGAGKTTFIKSLCEMLGVVDAVSSPTFSIVNEYVTETETIFHFDFYRIKKETEALDLGYEDYLYSGNYCFIEWPEKVPNLLPEKYVEVFLLETSPDSRLLKAKIVN